MYHMLFMYKQLILKKTILPSVGHSEYSYQQSSYGEQSYERSFEDSSQHYYEGGGVKCMVTKEIDGDGVNLIYLCWCCREPSV